MNETYICSCSFTTADQERETLYPTNNYSRGSDGWPSLQRSRMLPANEQQWPSHSNARISHQAFLLSASTKAQARQAESDKTPQGKADAGAWCALLFSLQTWYLPLALPLRCIQNLSVPELSPRKTNCRDIQKFLYSFFAAILYLDFKALLPNNPTGNGRLDALRGR